MKIFKEYIAYLKDNPEGYWFKRKLYGFGWTPAKPAGWITIGIYILFLLGVTWHAEFYEKASEDITQVVAIVIGATVLLSVIMWRTGEPLKWQWGEKQSKQ